MGFFSKSKPAATEAKRQTAPPALGSHALAPAQVACDTGLTPGLKRNLLLVDASENALREFNRFLQHRTKFWELTGAANAAEALSLLENSAFDGIVTAARLPGSTGVELLNKLVPRYPNLVRLIRYAPEDKSLLRGFVGWPPLHLTRDMDGAEIEASLKGAFQLAEWMAKPAMKALLPQMRRLPTVPELYTKVMDLLSSLTSSTEDVGRLIAQDPALTIKMLQMVNSAAFALAHPVSSAVEAVLFLGAERTKALILVANTCLHFNLSECKGFSQEQFWQHCLSTAGLARSIMQMERVDAKLADEAFTAALLHDVGKLLFAANLPEKYSQMLAVARNQKMSDEQAERTAFGTSHAELGACLLGTWGLPLDLLRAISWHHAPCESGDGVFSLLTAVHAANALDHSRSGGPEDASIPKLDHRYLTRLDLNDRWLRWRELVADKAMAA